MKLADYLRAKKMTAAEFGQRVGATRAAVSFWCNDVRIPRPEQMEAIRRETGGRVTATDFYKRSEAA